MNTATFAHEMQRAIALTIEAHTFHASEPRNAIRYWDETTPYAIHPIWCAMTLLTETRLPDDVRYHGYLALLWHDLLEDTTMQLPHDIHPDVAQLVHEMTFDDFEHEVADVWGRSDTTKLLKLYDKVSALLDATWMSDEKWNRFVDHALKLLAFVEQHYGELNITKFARVICIRR